MLGLGVNAMRGDILTLRGGDQDMSLGKWNAGLEALGWTSVLGSVGIMAS